MFTFTGGAPKDERRIHIVGTKGSISGVFEENLFTLRHYDHEKGYTEDLITDLLSADELHGGGDEDLTLDFCRYIQGDAPSCSCTELNESLTGHLVVFAAEKSRKTGKPVHIDI